MLKRYLFEFLMLEVVFLMLGLLSARVLTVFKDSTVTWRSLGTPPGGALHILDGNRLSVRVETAGGQVYSCRWRYGKECWVLEERHSKPPYTVLEEPFISRTYRQPPALPAAVETKTFYDVPNEYTHMVSMYAVTANGKVYAWQDGRSDGFDPLITNCLAIPASLLIGLAFWGLMSWLEAVSRKRMRAALKST